jgi:hypothetical protein
MTHQHLIGVILLAFFWFVLLDVNAKTPQQKKVFSLICAGLLIAALAIFIINN